MTEQKLDKTKPTSFRLDTDTKRSAGDHIECLELLVEFEPEIQQKAAVADSLGKPYLIVVGVTLNNTVRIGIVDWEDAEDIFQAECPKEWGNVKRASEQYPDTLVAVCQCRSAVAFKIIPKRVTKYRPIEQKWQRIRTMPSQGAAGRSLSPRTGLSSRSMRVEVRLSYKDMALVRCGFEVGTPTFLSRK
jgi:hypothetical protein